MATDKITAAREETLSCVDDVRNTLVDFAKRVAAMADEFDPDLWDGIGTAETDYEDIDDFHQALQAEMNSLDTDYEDLKTIVFDLETDLTTWSDLIQDEEARLDSIDEDEMEAADLNYRRDA